MVDKLKRLLKRLRGSGPEVPIQPSISKDTVASALHRRPRRICFSSTHQNALKRQDGARWVGSFSVPFRESVYPIFYEMTDLELKESSHRLEGQQRPTWWRSVRDDDEFETVEKWIAGVSSLVFMSDQLALSICLAEHQTPEGGRSEVGTLEYKAKWHRDADAIRDLTKRCASTIRELPHYRDANAVCAVPPGQGKDFDLPSLIAKKLATRLEVPDLTSQLRWRSEKPSLKETPFADKWEALADVGLDAEEIEARSVILLDDLYQSGITMQFVAQRLLRAGAKQVFGLALVKSRRDSDNQ